MAERQPDWPLLERFLAGECAPAEVARVQRWLDSQPDAAMALAVLRSAIGRQASPEGPVRWDVESAWERLDAVTREDVGMRYRLPPPLRRAGAGDADRRSFEIGWTRRPAVSRWLRVAAVVVLVGSGVAGTILWRSSRSAPSAVVASAAPRVVTTQRMERAELRLPDGTRAILAPDSRLVIPADFDRTSRTVALEGEGYFEVAHNPGKPFLVRAGRGLIHDLGTRFTVRAYAGDSAVRVVVAEGRVAVGALHSTLPLRGPVLRVGDLAWLGRSGVATVIHGVDVDRYLSWTEGRLRFVATPLRDVLPQLTRWYDVEFELADSGLGDRRISIAFGSEPLAQALDAVALVTHARYERSGRIVRFVPLPATSGSRVP